MKKIAPIVVLLLVAMLAWEVLAGSHDYYFGMDGDEFDGPLGAFFGLLLCSLGLVIGLIVSVFVAIVLAVVFAGVGVLVVAALVLAALVVAAAVSPLLLPLLIPIAIIWFFMSRSRRNRMKGEAV
jgi:hypothetical protein